MDALEEAPPERKESKQFMPPAREEAAHPVWRRLWWAGVKRIKWAGFMVLMVLVGVVCGFLLSLDNFFVNACLEERKGPGLIDMPSVGTQR